MNTALLTIDDLSSKNTPALVDYLTEKGIPAIFFAVGMNVEKYYDEALYAEKRASLWAITAIPTLAFPPSLWMNP